VIVDRRQFLKESALAISLGQVASSQRERREWVLENGQLAWRLEESVEGIRSVGFDSRLSGRRFALEIEAEFTLVFSSGQRLEIPWWNSRYTDATPTEPDRETGLVQGFHRPGAAPGTWAPVANLCGGRKGRVYGGYAWFRHNFSLPESARGKEIVFVLGGYDQQDWNERWIYVNGQEAGHSQTTGRWRVPSQYVLRPADPSYASLHFGPESSNLLAVRACGYDFRSGGIADEVLNRQVFRPFLFDQFVSIGTPFRSLSAFEVIESHRESPEKIRFVLRDAEHRWNVIAHYELSGFVRRKWLEIRNDSSQAELLLDVEVDRFRVDAQGTEGGQGDPVFLENEAFFGLEHPAGVNQNSAGMIRLWHAPGKQIGPGETIRSAASLAGVAPRNQVLDQFHAYITSRSPRARKKHISLYTCFGINNQWGGCPALTDAEVLDCQKVVRSWQSKGVKMDYFTLDTGWPDNAGDLTEFAAACYPDGPQKILRGIEELGMKFGLWFSVSGGGWSDGSYPAIQSSAIPAPGSTGEPPTAPPVPAYRNGYPAGGGVGRTLCVSSDAYFNVLKSAIQHHVRDNHLRLLKLDIGDYYCNSAHHEHLPGRYSTEAMFNRLIDIADSARAIAPDVFVVWYWGVGASPFWALHGDTIFESGLFMEGSGTSWYPSLYYRDSVTLSLDQSTRFARFVPPLLKDSLGVWLSQIRWANFMGKSRWRESLIMDLGRGNLMFPQLWGDPNLLNDNDLAFLAEIMAFARNREAILLRPRRDIGDAMKNDPYGYAFFDGARGLFFCHNMHFAARKMKLPLGLSGMPLQLTSYFPKKEELRAEDGSAFRAGGSADFWMRPFETLLLEIGPATANHLPRRRFAAPDAAEYGKNLTLDKTQPASQPASWMQLTFADRDRFEKAGMSPAMTCFSCGLPALPEGRSILAIHVKLRRGQAEYRYSPTVAEVVQLRSRLGGHDIQLIPVPDARQFGNTQNAGCSWVVYKIALAPAHSEQLLEFAIHSYLPAGVEALTEAWLVKQWWEESARPEADGYYGQAPS